MAKTKPDRICGDCIHIHACQSWTSGILDDTDARPCRNYETVTDSNAYYIGHHDGMVDGCDRQKPMEPEMDRSLSEIKQEPILLCPNCRAVLDYGIDEHDYNYCYNCGQALDWTEQEG